MKTIQTITNQQLQILILLYRFRFLTRLHIQQLLNHKNHQRILTWLKDLETKGYIKSKTSTRLGAIQNPTIYYLATKSKYVLEDVEGISPTYLSRVYKESYKSQVFVDHCLEGANLNLYFAIQTKSTKEELFFFTKQDLKSYNYFPHPLPDSYIALKNSKNTSRYFVEVIDENVPRFAIKKRIEQYIEYSDERKWQENSEDKFPAILLFSPNPGTKKFLHSYILGLLEEGETEIEFYLISHEEVKNNYPWQKIV